MDRNLEHYSYLQVSIYVLLKKQTNPFLLYCNIFHGLSKKNGVLIIFLISALQRHGGYSLIIQLFTSTYLCTVFKQLLTVKVMNSLDILLLDFFWHSIISRVFSLSSATFDLVCCSFDSWIRARPTKTKLKCFDFKSGYLALCSEI